MEAALADILFGKVNPCGKLPFAVATDESAYPDICWDTDQQEYGYYHGYQKIDRDQSALDYPFGHGLSYTTFSLKDIRLAKCDRDVAGKQYGAEVVQLYIGYEESAVARPLRTLRCFEKVFLDPGECKEVMLSVRKKDLAWYDETISDWVEDNITYIAYIGTDEQNCSENKILFRFPEI